MTSTTNPSDALEFGGSLVGPGWGGVDALQDPLSDPEEFMRRLIESSEDCITVLDLDGRLLWMNAGAMRRLDTRDLARLRGAMWFELWSPDFHETVRHAVSTARQGRVARFVGYGFQEEIRTEHRFDEIVGNDPVLLEALRKVELVAPLRGTCPGGPPVRFDPPRSRS